MTLSEKVYCEIKRDLNSLAFSSNEFINENAMAERYGVSKAPVREALHRLCREGILISYPRKGYLIATLSEKEYKQIQHLRYVNECVVLEILAEKATKERILAILQSTAEETDVMRNTSFHQNLANATDNKVLAEIVEKLLGMVSRNLTLLYSLKKGISVVNYHKEITRALMEKDIDLAKAYLKKDLEI
ncbi:MAG: transcriptional regulator [Clostridiales bacterium]|jgi:DNA-binding GntR family transcriptional regulator|nr:transcriptional regulator [Clostridiales bacterium]